MRRLVIGALLSLALVLGFGPVVGAAGASGRASVQRVDAAAVLPSVPGGDVRILSGPMPQPRLIEHERGGKALTRTVGLAVALVLAGLLGRWLAGRRVRALSVVAGRATAGSRAPPGAYLSV